MNFDAQLKQNATAYAEVEKQMKSAGVKYLQTHMADLNGTFRSKITPFKVAKSGDALNGILYCITNGDGQPTGDVAFEAPIANAESGYPNVQAVVDPLSFRQHGWDPEVASAIISGYLLNGQPCPLDARLLLERMDASLREMGIEVKVALEYEFGVFHLDADLMRQGQYHNLKPWGDTMRNYDLARSGEYQEFVKEYYSRMESLGVGISSFVTEYGFGMYEFALTPKSPLEAADDAVRAKTHLSELCAERGLVATFMTRFQPPGKESACGAHQHVSLWKDGEPITIAEDGKLSSTASSFVAGILNRMRETHLFFRPTINSYRRFDRDSWSPVDVTWGFENRTAALRMITTPSPAAARIEHRVGGADICPYLTLAAIIASGVEGLKAEMPLQDASVGMEHHGGRVMLDDNLKASIDTFESSQFCKTYFGEEFCDHYALGRKNELAAYEKWAKSHITEFEWRRYFL